jgi:Tfp pilus assembly protein PilF
LRKLFFLLVTLVCLSAAAYFGRDRIRLWNRRKIELRAVASVQKGDYNSAILYARQVLQTDPGNAPMCRLIARIADAAGTPEAILWWSRAVKADGGKFDDIAMLVSSALLNGETGVAGEALDQVREQDRELLPYHLLAAGYETAIGQLSLADEEFSRAAAMKPEDKSIQLNLASLHLKSSSPETALAARSELEKLAEDPALRVPAMRALLSDARLHGDSGKALQIARTLATGTNAAFEDGLAWLEVTKSNNKVDFGSELKSVQKTVAGDPGLIRRLVHWMNEQDMASQSLEWLRSLPDNIQSLSTVQFAAAESLAVLGKWEELRVMVMKCNWQDLEFLRYAIQARAARETLHTVESAEKWEKAVIATNGDVRMQSMLARLVSVWGWNRESEQMWWLIARHGSGQNAALQALFKLYSDAKNTPQLYRVIERIYELDPVAPTAINNMASVSLLLGKNLEMAHQLASKNYSRYPKYPVAASTYAYSLYCQKKVDEGLKVLAVFPEETLRQPSNAVYYGLLLAAAGEGEKAAVYLDIAAKSSELLPEEKALVKQARRP